MNTLSRAVTARIFPNPDAYNALRQQWSRLINSERRHELTAAHHLFYLALTGKDWRRGFTVPINRRKLENGAFWGWAMFRALQVIHNRFKEQELLAPFDGLITPQMLVELRRWLPSGNPYSHRLEEFVDRKCPFDAYLEGKGVNAIVPFKGTFHD